MTESTKSSFSSHRGETLMKALRRAPRSRSTVKNRPPRRALPLFLVLASILGLVAMTAGAPESQNYRIDRMSVVSGGTTSMSQNYTTLAVIGQLSPSGAASACDAGTVSGFGFWSVLGPRPAPIFLTVDLSETDPQSVRLSWSGVEPLFQVYRNDLPDELLNPLNVHAETAACGISVDETAAGNIVYYRVVEASAD